MTSPTPAPAGPPPSSTADVDAARKAGGYAARHGRPVTDCPYDPRSKQPGERARASAWMRGYLHWRPPRGLVDYDDVEVDEEQ